MAFPTVRARYTSCCTSRYFLVTALPLCLPGGWWTGRRLPPSSSLHSFLAVSRLSFVGRHRGDSFSHDAGCSSGDVLESSGWVEDQASISLWGARERRPCRYPRDQGYQVLGGTIYPLSAGYILPCV
jgi:hypothetical protein